MQVRQARGEGAARTERQSVGRSKSGSLWCSLVRRVSRQCARRAEEGLHARNGTVYTGASEHPEA
eukprot:1157378-Pelagomonas_calceolata.AAC.2